MVEVVGMVEVFGVVGADRVVEVVEVVGIVGVVLGHQQMYDLERFYGTKVGFYKGTDSYKSYKLVQTPIFSVRLMP